MQIPKLYLYGTILVCALLFNSCGNRGQAEVKLTPIDSIRLSDPFILADKATNSYYMTGTGGMMWKSSYGPVGSTMFIRRVWHIRKAEHSMGPGSRRRNR